MNRVPFNEPVLLSTNPVTFDLGALVEIVERGNSTQVPVYSAETGGSKLQQPLKCGIRGVPVEQKTGLRAWVAPGSYDLLVGVAPAEGEEDKRQRVPLEMPSGGADAGLEKLLLEKEPLDSDLLAFAALKPKDGAMLVREGETWKAFEVPGANKQLIVRNDGTLAWTDFPKMRFDAWGCKGDGSNNDAIPIRECWDAAKVKADTGETVIIQGRSQDNYKLGSGINNGGLVAVPRNLTGRIEFHGEGCRFTATDSCRRLFDMVRNGETKHDVVRHFKAKDFNFDTAETHRKEKGEHAVFGNFLEGSIQKYLSVEDVELENVNVLNLYTHGADGEAITKRAAVRVYVRQDNPFAEEATRDFVKGLRVTEVRTWGGRYGLDVGAENSSGGLANVLIDEVVYDNCFHTVGQELGGSGGASCNFQIGHDCIGGRYEITGCVGELSNDVGVEVDSPTYCVVNGCKIKDARNTCYLGASQGMPAEGLATTYFQNCKAIRNRESNKCRGFVTSGGSGSKSTGARYYYDSCWVHSERESLENNNDCWQLEDSQSLVSIVNSGFHVALTYAGEAAVNPIFVRWNPKVSGGRLFIRNFEARVSGKRTGSGSLKVTMLQLGGTAGTASVLDIDGFNVISQLEGASPSSQFVRVASGATEVTYRGRLGVNVIEDGDDPSASGIYVNSGARIDGELILTGDTRGMDGPEAKSVNYHGELPEAHKAKIKQRNFIGRTLPVPSSAVALAGESPWSLRNLQGWASRYIVRGGKVTNIEVSVDEGANWDTVGILAGMVYLDQGDMLRISGTEKPEVKAVPLR